MIKKVILCERCLSLKAKQRMYEETSKLRDSHAHKGMTEYVDWMDRKLFKLNEEIGTTMADECTCEIVYQPTF